MKLFEQLIFYIHNDVIDQSELTRYVETFTKELDVAWPTLEPDAVLPASRSQKRR